VRGGKCMVLRSKSTLGTNLRFWKVFCNILSAGKRTFFLENLIRQDPCLGKLAIVQRCKECLLNFCGSSIPGHSVSREWLEERGA
jgi:hypothetical protein